MLTVLLGGCWFFPESPQWLCTAGRREEAHSVLTPLRGWETRWGIAATAMVYLYTFIFLVLLGLRFRGYIPRRVFLI
jgi:hypothetical protein